MQIAPTSHGDLLELRVTGRLDSEWAETLRKAIDDALRQGYHSVVVDAAEIDYVSSAGLAVLVNAHKQFQTIRGYFGVGGAIGPVEEVIRLTGLAKMLLCDLETVRRARGQGRSTIQLPARVAATELASFEIYDLDRTARVSWNVFGDPSRFDEGTYTSADTTETPFTEDSCVIGLGAFGERFEDCATRFGELLAVAGAVALLPANGASVPDYQMARNEFVPKAQMLYGVKWTGPFARLLRFDIDNEDQHLSLTGLVDQALSLAETDAAAFVMLAETSGLVGAALRKPPTVSPASATSRFHHPEIRDWLHFTPERAFAHALAVVVGVAGRGPRASPSLAPFLRPMSVSRGLHGHFHAAVFPFRPFKKRRIEISETVPALFDTGAMLGLLHLIHDERPISGAGDSEFLRGACWMGPLLPECEMPRG
jgi:anti-anti-sigma factor